MAKSEYDGPAAGIAKVMRADAKYLGAIDMDASRDAWVTIVRVEALDNEEIAGKVSKSRKFALTLATLAGAPLPKQLILNKTNLRMIRTLHGEKTAHWKGKPICLYLTTCDAFGEKNTPCVRIRNASKPPANLQRDKPQTEETQPQLGDAAEGAN